MDTKMPTVGSKRNHHHHQSFDLSLTTPLLYNGYIFQLVALEVQGSLGESSELFITRLCEMLCRSHDDQRAGSFLKQLNSMALRIGNAACVLGTERRSKKFITYSLIFLTFIS